MEHQPSAPQGLPFAELDGTNGSLAYCPSTMTVQWAENDPQHPYNLSLKTKWLAVITVSLGTLCV
jgi:hypothetical protein